MAQGEDDLRGEDPLGDQVRRCSEGELAVAHAPVPGDVVYGHVDATGEAPRPERGESPVGVPGIRVVPVDEAARRTCLQMGQQRVAAVGVEVVEGAARADAAARPAGSCPSRTDRPARRRERCMGTRAPRASCLISSSARFEADRQIGRL